MHGFYKVLTFFIGYVFVQERVVAKAHEGWVDELLADFDSTQAEELIQQLGGLARGGDKQP